MVKTLLVSGNSVGAGSTANTTQYLCLTGAAAFVTTSETTTQLLIRTAGVLSNLYIRISANSVAGSSTFTSRKNAAAGNQTISVGSSATGEFEDAVNTDTVAAGDKFNVRSVPGATTNTYALTIVSALFAATTDTHTYGGLRTTQAAAIGVTRYFPFEGGVYNATETNVQYKMRQAGTFKNLCINVSANTITAASTLKSRKNTANGNLTLSITASTTGFFEDTANSDAVVLNDLYCTQLITGATGTNISPNLVSMDFVSTAGLGLIQCSNGLLGTIAEPVTAYIGFDSDVNINTATEAFTQMKARAAFTFSDLSANVTANGVAASTTIKLRKNAADATNVVSIGNAATGFFQDTTHTDLVAATDKVNFQIITPATTGTPTITIVYISIMTFLAVPVLITRALSETVTISDTLTRVYKAKRSLSETSITIADSLIRIFKARRSIAQTVTISDALTRKLIAKRSLSETTTVADSLARKLLAKRSISESAITVSDAISRVFKARRSTSETVIVSDSLSRRLLAKRSISETAVSISDSLARIIRYPRSISEPAVSVSDSLTRRLLAKRSLTNTITIADSLARKLLAKRTISEAAVTISDVLVGIRTTAGFFARSMSEAITVSDSLSRRLLAKRSISEPAITIVDSLLRVFKARRSTTENVNVSDSIVRRLFAKRSISDPSLVVSDTLSRVLKTKRSLTEPSILVSDVLSRIYKAKRSLSETIVVADSLVRRLFQKRNISEPGITVSDSLTRKLLAKRSMAETITIADSLTRFKRALRSIAEPAITVTDSIVRRLKAIRTIQEDVITITDVLTFTTTGVILVSVVGNFLNRTIIHVKVSTNHIRDFPPFGLYFNKLLHWFRMSRHVP